MKKETLQNIVYSPLYLWFKLHAILPMRILYILSDILYFPLYYIVHYRRKLVSENLRKAFPDKTDKELKQLVQRGALLKNEGREVEKLLMNNNPDDGVTGGATLWKLTQGITAFARAQQPERCRELHEISGQLLNRVKVN